MNASNSFVDIPLSVAIQQRKHQEFAMQQIDWDTARGLSDSGKHAYGIDEKLEPLLGLFAEE